MCLRKRDNEENNWDFESMVTVKKVATTGFRAKLQKVPRVFEECGKAVSTTVVGIIELAREGIKVSRKNAAMSDR